MMSIYVHLSKEYLLYSEDTKSWHQWTRTYWITTDVTQIAGKVYRFVVTLSFLGIDKSFAHGNSQ